MAKKKGFKELSEAEFEKLSPDEQNKYLVDLDAFEKSKGSSGEESEEEKSIGEKMKERAEQFFNDNEDYPHKSIFVTSDLNVFHGTLKGRNSVDNHCKSSGNTFSEFSKD